MAIYRPQRPRWILPTVTAVAGLLVGLLVGWGLLRPEPDPAEALQTVRTEVVGAAGSLEVFAIEYAEAVENAQVVAPRELEGARAALASSRERYEAVAGAVTVIAPDAAAAITQTYDELERLSEQRAPEEDVAALADELDELLKGVIGA